MFGRNFAGIGFSMGKSLFMRNTFKFSNSMAYMQTQANYLKYMPASNALCLQNLREMLLSKGQLVDLQLADLTSFNQVISLILRGNQPRNIGTLTAKCHIR